MTPLDAPASGAAIGPMSVRDAAGVVTDVLGPLIAEGLIIRRPRMTDLFDRVGAHRRAVRRLQRVRGRYGEGPAILSLPGRRIAFVLSPQDARRVLDHTPELFAAATREKRAALSRFEPHGVLVTTGALREPRRRYNEEILETSRAMHHLSDRFAGVIDAEVAVMLGQAEAAGSLGWERFAKTWWRIVRRIVLGDSARDDERVTDELARLRADANWGPLGRRRPRRREAFLDRVRSYVARADPGCLAAEVATHPAGEAIDPVQQIPQWLFAFDAAGMASFRTLALLDAHPEVARRIRDGARSDTNADAPQWPLARACMLESVRLWPTTPAILRAPSADTSWRNGTVRAGTTVVIFVPFFHRDERTLPAAHTFSPDLWLGEHEASTVLMPFSLGPARCPGRNLVLRTTSVLLVRMLMRSELAQSHERPLRGDVPLPVTLSPFRLCFTVRRNAARFPGPTSGGASEEKRSADSSV